MNEVKQELQSEFAEFIPASFGVANKVVSLFRQIMSAASFLPAPIAAIIKFVSYGLELIINTVQILGGEKSWKEKLKALGLLLAFTTLAVAAAALAIAFPLLPMIGAGIILALCVADFGVSLYKTIKTYREIQKTEVEMQCLSKEIDDKDCEEGKKLETQPTLNPINLFKLIDLKEKQESKKKLQSHFNRQRVGLIGTGLCIVGATLLVVAAAPVIAAATAVVAAITTAATVIMVAASAIFAAISIWTLGAKVEEEAAKHQTQKTEAKAPIENNAVIAQSHYNYMANSLAAAKAGNVQADKPAAPKPESTQLPTAQATAETKKEAFTSIFFKNGSSKERPRVPLAVLFPGRLAL